MLLTEVIVVEKGKKDQLVGEYYKKKLEGAGGAGGAKKIEELEESTSNNFPRPVVNIDHDYLLRELRKEEQPSGRDQPQRRPPTTATKTVEEEPVEEQEHHHTAKAILCCCCCCLHLATR